MSSGAGKVVCVTGASGYIASWLVKHLLERGYTVRATVRSLGDPKKIAHLKALEGAEERLHLFEANLIEDGSFDSAVGGCDGVFHTASPVSLSPTANPQEELIKPAVEGTLNVLRSCSKVPSIRRVVLTSSTATVCLNRNFGAADVFVDETSFSDLEYCKETEQWYAVSKILAEKAAWQFAKENGMDLVTLHPSLVLGPLLQPTLNLTSKFIMEIFEGKGLFPSYRLVDVQDVADAHIMAFENPSANGRYCLVGTTLAHSEILQVLHKLYPSINVPTVATTTQRYQVSKKKAESLGINFTPFEVSLKNFVESLKEKNFLSL